jgi:hypothetical protein
MNVMQALLDSVKDYIIPHITKKKTAKEMYNALATLYQSVNVYMKVLLRNKLTTLTTTCMSKTDIVATHLMKLTEL